MNYISVPCRLVGCRVARDANEVQCLLTPEPHEFDPIVVQDCPSVVERIMERSGCVRIE